MQKMLKASVGVAALLVGVAALMTSADARRGGGFSGGGGHFHAGSVNRSFSANRNVNIRRNANVNRNVNINRNVSRNVNVNRNVGRNVNVNRNINYAYRNGRRGFWRNGVWIAAPVAAGAAYVASCAYEYNRWHSTGSSYWRDRYYQCSN